MASDLKNFPASDLKLQRLRDSGVVPLSSDVLVFAVALGLTLGGLVLYALVIEDFLSYAHKLFGGSLVDMDYGVGDSLRFACRAIFLVLIPLVLVVTLFGLLQSKFLLAWRNIWLDFSRLFSGSDFFANLFGRGASSFLSLTKVVLWLLVCFFSLTYLSSYFAVLMAIPEVDISSYISFDKAVPSDLVLNADYFLALRKPIFVLVGIGLVFSFFMAVMSYFFATLVFYQRHRMTRQELELENREMEQSSELRSARNELRDQ